LFNAQSAERLPLVLIFDAVSDIAAYLEDLQQPPHTWRSSRLGTAV